MENKILCPDCEKHFYIKAGRCSCGWSPLNKEEKASPDFRCEYTLIIRRCPLPGTICLYPHSTQGPWYCSEHWRTLADPKRAEEALQHAEENYASIMESRRDWRRQPVTYLGEKHEKQNTQTHRKN